MKNLSVCFINDDKDWVKNIFILLKYKFKNITLYSRKNIQAILKSDVLADIYFIDIGGIGLTGIFQHYGLGNTEERYLDYLRPFESFCKKHPNSKIILTSGLINYAKSIFQDLKKDNLDLNLSYCSLERVKETINSELVKLNG